MAAQVSGEQTTGVNADRHGHCSIPSQPLVAATETAALKPAITHRLERDY